MPKTIEEQFTNWIRNKLTDKQFWEWVSEWFDAETIIEIAEEWDNGMKEEILNEWKQKYETTNH